MILKTEDSDKCKSLERKVINFNQELWYNLLYQKFIFIINTNDNIIVENYKI